MPSSTHFHRHRCRAWRGRRRSAAGASRSVSDGAENVGQAIDQAAQAALESVPIDVLALPGVSASDLRVDGISAPTSAWEGESRSQYWLGETNRDGPVTVELLVDGQVKTTEEVELAEGLSSRAFTSTISPLDSTRSRCASKATRK